MFERILVAVDGSEPARRAAAIWWPSTSARTARMGRSCGGSDQTGIAGSKVCV